MIWVSTVAIFAYLYGGTGRTLYSLGATAVGFVAFGLYWLIRTRIIMARPEFILEQATGALYTPALRFEKLVAAIVIPVITTMLWLSVFSNGGTLQSSSQNTLTPSKVQSQLPGRELTDEEVFGQPGNPSQHHQFFSAIREGGITSVRQYLQAGVSANVTSTPWEMPALYFAQLLNRPNVMMVLIQNGAALNTKFGPSQRTALHDAALSGRIECMRVLLKAGADPNPLNKFGRTPLTYATNPTPPLTRPTNHSEVVALLREHGGK